jgi:hypothetical protein
MDLYFGTLNNETIIKNLKKDESYSMYNLNNMSDKDITDNFLDKGLVKNCFSFFFAKDLNDAKTKAKEMGLKNFSKVSNIIYEENKDF